MEVGGWAGGGVAALLWTALDAVRAWPVCTLQRLPLVAGVRPVPLRAMHALQLTRPPLGAGPALPLLLLCLV